MVLCENVEPWGELAQPVNAFEVSAKRSDEPFVVIELDADGTQLLDDLKDIRQKLLWFFVGVMDDVTGSFTPFTEVVRLTTSSDDAHVELPDAGCALETPDGRFRIWAEVENGKIRLTVEAMGLAADEFAHKRIGIAAASPGDERMS